MPTIERILQIGVEDQTGNTNYSVEITPDDGLPGFGDLIDTSNHSSKWSSVDGKAVSVLIFGRPPFRARQVQMSPSEPVGEVHDQLISSKELRVHNRDGKQ